MNFNCMRIGVGALICATSIWAGVNGPCIADIEAPEWPKEIDFPKGKIVIYQPQADTFKDDKLTGRAAVSVTMKDKPEPVFGAVWIDARVSTDRDARTVTILDIKVPKVRFPHATPEQEAKLSKILETHFPQTGLTFSLDRLLTSLDLAEKEQVAADRLSTHPPRIIFSSTPAVLVILDGKPKLQRVKNSRVMRVVNTPFLILFDTEKPAFYLEGGGTWLTASDIMGPWQTAEKVPPAVLAAAPAEPVAIASPAATPQPVPTAMPRIIVSTEPAELIVSDGEPTWTPIVGDELLYMSNTGSDMFMEVASSHYYVLLAGRWFWSARLNGPWTYAAPDKLPPSFAKIPPDSSKGRVRANIAGTQEAKDAVLDASIPQTAAIKRSEAKLTVTYDGPPQFKNIEGTDMSYAVNTQYSVIKAEGKYYCCYQAVWYVAASPMGPWSVCSSVPKEIYTIPPTCPIYNVRYVYVYDSTPDEVNVGYLPGYTGNYAYDGTVVYGTGYSYPGWFDSDYYPEPCTWGFDPVYYPWTGTWYHGVGPWGHDWVYSNGYGGWWGPGGYHSWGSLADKYNVKVEDGKISVGGQTYTRDELRDQIERERKGVNAQNIPGKNARPGEGKLTIGDKTFTRDELRGNIYKREDNPLRTAELSRGRSLQAPKVANGVENNIFADRNGDIYRLKDNWEQYGKDGWSKSFAPSAGKESHELARPASSSVQRSEVAGRDITQIHGWSRPAVSDIPEREISSPERDSARGDLDRQNWARQRGEERVNDFQRNFPNGGTFAGGRERQGSEGRHHDFNGSHQSFGGGRPSFESRGHGSRGGGGSHGGGFHGGGGGRR